MSKDMIQLNSCFDKIVEQLQSKSRMAKNTVSAAAISELLHAKEHQNMMELLAKDAKKADQRGTTGV